jgi:eukaryotic-like serine/threonine-protein kinase
MLKAARPTHFGSADAAKRPDSSDSQPESPGDRQPSTTESIDVRQATTAMAPVRSTTHAQKVAHSLITGQIVARRFRVLRFINSGGMGEVFEAWDSELGDRVALKTIRPDISSLPSAIDRFKQEVRQARTISHVNVCRVYEVFSHVLDSGEQLWFLTMELLADRLRREGPIPSKQALDLALQMVAGLAAAHEHSVAHRDFKASNVMLVEHPTGKTRVVVTDFGLALRVATGQHAEPEQSKFGTPLYMAPEQVHGGEVGFAADQYALGVVMCEMLTGKCPMRPDPASGMDKALLPPGHHLNARWESIIRRCLEFRPEDRFPAIRDVASALNPVRQPKSPWIIATAAVLCLVSGLVALRVRAGDRVEGASQLTPDTDLTSRPSLSRSGKMVTYSSDRAEAGNLDIWVQTLPSGVPKRLTTNPAEDVDSNLAPDGRAVVFRSERDGGGIYTVEVAGGQERLLARYGRNPRFSPDGRRVAYWVGDYDATVASGQIFVVSLADRSSERLAANFKDARSPVWSSDGRHILFTGCRDGHQSMSSCAEWWAITLDGQEEKNTGALSLLRREHVDLNDEIGGWYGDIVLFNGGQGPAWSLWELKLPQSTLRAEGKPSPVTSGEAREVAPSLAANDTIAFERLTAALHIWKVDSASASKPAEAVKLTHAAEPDYSPNVSGNGRWLVFERGFGTKHDIWIKDMQSGAESLFASSAMEKHSPIIDDTGTRLVFEGREENVASVFTAVQGQSPRKLTIECENPTSWFDLNRSFFCKQGLPSKIKIVDIDTAVSFTVLEKKDYSLSEATWSPQNQYLLFTASRNGTSKQVFAVRFSKNARMPVGEWIPITSETEFSGRPRWSGDGKTIFYLSTRDGFSCVWGQHFDPRSGRTTSPPFGIIHYHNPRFSPHVVVERAFNLTAAGDSIYLNVGEINASVWIGTLKRHHSFSSFLQSPR